MKKNLLSISIQSTYFEGKFYHALKVVIFDDWTDSSCYIRDEHKANHEMLRLMRKGGIRKMDYNHLDHEITYRTVRWNEQD